MQAPDFPTLLNITGAVEAALATTLNSIEVEGETIEAFAQRSGQELPGECVGVQMTLGNWTGSFGLDLSGKMQRRAWSYTLRLLIATPESIIDRERHGKILGAVKYAMTLGDTFAETEMPYHVLSTVKEVTESEAVQDKDDENLTTLSYTGIVCIRNNAWPPAP